MSHFHDMEMFLAAARYGSFTRAATEMRTSVGAVSRAIARLELHMDCRLFNRTTRRVNLTAEGRLALTEVSAGMARLENARALLHEQRQQAAGTLKVLTPIPFAKHYLMPELPKFLEQHPHLELDMHMDDFGVDLLAGGFDLAVQFAPVPPNGYISRMLGTMEVLMVASPAYLAQHGVPRTIEDLAGHKCLQVRGRTGGPPYQWQIQQVTGGPVTVHHPAGQCFINGQLDVIIQGALCGLGISPIDLRAVVHYLRSGDLKVVLPDYRLVGGSDVLLLYPHRDRVPIKARVFMDLIAEIGRTKMTIPGFDFHVHAA